MNAYLDYAATTPLDKEIFEKMLPYLREEFGNPDSLHAYGRRAAYAVACARDRVAATLGVLPNEVYFTSGGTEADNWAVRRMAEGGVCASPIEHAAVLQTAGTVRGSCVTAVGEDGIVTADHVAAALEGAPQAGLACVMAVNNETGCIQPIEEISALCKARGVLLFSDCVQAATTQDLKALCRRADGISLSSHKIYGPKGAGALVVKQGVKLRPLLTGGEQERGLRGGTLNVAAIVGFSYALEAAQRTREEFCRKTLALRTLFEEEIRSALGDAAEIDGENRAPNISHITFRQGGEWLLHRLDLCGIACSGGAACSAHSALPSHVMLAMNRGGAAGKGVRFSFGKRTCEEEVRYAAAQLIALLRESKN